ncbi:DUF302 domain-containing protein [Thermoplasma volcanium]|nr:DUF302 domain-containing protein [Thermoplasma volcanium]
MYKYERKVNGTVEEVYGKLFTELKKRGYVVLSYIDVAQILKNALKKDVDPYYILNVCKPSAADEILSVSRDYGLFLPCKIVLKGEGDKVTISMQYVSTQINDYMGQDGNVAVKYEKEIEEAIKDI